MTPVLNVVLPVFAIILAGYLSGRRALLGDANSDALNRFVYWMALPALLFGSMARVPVRDVFEIPFLLAFVGGMAITFAIAVLGGGALFPNRLAGRTLQGLAAVFANTGYMGLPLFLTAYGPERMLPAVIGTVFNAAIAVGAAVIVIEIDLSQAARLRHLARDVLLALVRNPLVTAPVAGLLFSATGLSLPKPVETFCSLLGAAAGPCALFALGLFLVGRRFAEQPAELAWITILKLVVQPAITWVLAVPILHMDPVWASAAVLLAALPTGALVFTLAQTYGVYVERASAATLVTTVVSIVTLSAVLLLLQP